MDDFIDLERRISRTETDISALYDKLNSVDKNLVATTTSLNILVKTTEGLKDSIEELKQRPTKRWDTVITGIIGSAVSFFVAYLLAKGGIL